MPTKSLHYSVSASHWFTEWPQEGNCPWFVSAAPCALIPPSWRIGTRADCEGIWLRELQLQTGQVEQDEPSRSDRVKAGHLVCQGCRFAGQGGQARKVIASLRPGCARKASHHSRGWQDAEAPPYVVESTRVNAIYQAVNSDLKFRGRCPRFAG
jgi:hypothetical protein